MDPFSMSGWECFRREALARELKPLLGMEIRVRQLGSLLLYPVHKGGYFSLVTSYNNKLFTRMDGVLAIFSPRRGNPGTSALLQQVLRQMSPGNFYLGLEWNSGRWVVDLARKHKIPLVWVQPLKWVSNPEKYAVASAVFNHHPVSDILMGSLSGELPLFAPMSGHAIKQRWGDAGVEAMKNTWSVAERIEFDFSDITAKDLSEPLIPASCAAFREGVFDANSSLEEAVNREMTGRACPLTQAERERVYRELTVIREQGFAVYFLIAAEIGDYCRRNKIYYNLRGSGVSSYILYLLGLSRVNPLSFDLLFERFVNSLRDDLPDIDIDIDSSRRSQVLQWVFARYEKKVVFVSTHKFYKARSALYDVARSYGYNAEESHEMSKEPPMYASPSVLRGKGFGAPAKVCHMAALLEGVFREYSLHLGGVLFSGLEVRRSFPLEKSPQGFEQVIWDKNTIERLRVFKLDLLGVRGFDVISPVALSDSVDFQDAEVWANIQNGRTIGCFQQESPLVRETLQKVRPRDLHELAVTIAIIRPGPAQSGMKQGYIEKKPPLHPVLEKIFPLTRGHLIFEEQISVLLHTVTGWNLERSEKIRRALKKGKGEEFREEFFRKGRGNGWKHSDLGVFWKLAGDFARYAFNQGHSVSYAYSSYISAWFKTKRPAAFFCRLLNSGGGYYPLPFYIEECRNWGIRLLPPDINRSQIGFSEEEGGIRTGLVFIRGIGVTQAVKITKNRGLGYVGMGDFVNRCGFGERDLATLAAVSALASLGQNGFNKEEQERNWKEYLGFIPS